MPGEPLSTGAVCPRCGAPMRVRTNRDSGEAFLGCSRFPACRGTRPGEATAHLRANRSDSPRRYKLSAGGRPRGSADYIELLVARAIGRNLTPVQGCVAQILATVIFASVVWAVFASGLILRIVEPVAQWYAEQALPRRSPSP